MEKRFDQKLEKPDKEFDRKLDELDKELKDLKGSLKTRNDALEKPFNRNINNLDTSGDGDSSSNIFSATPRNSRTTPISNELRVVLGYNSRLLNIYVSET